MQLCLFDYYFNFVCCYCMKLFEFLWTLTAKTKYKYRQAKTTNTLTLQTCTDKQDIRRMLETGTKKISRQQHFPVSRHLQIYLFQKYPSHTWLQDITLIITNVFHFWHFYVCTRFVSTNGILCFVTHWPFRNGSGSWKCLFTISQNMILWLHVNDVIGKYRPNEVQKTPLNTDKSKSTAPNLSKLELSFILLLFTFSGSFAITLILIHERLFEMSRTQTHTHTYSNDWSHNLRQYWQR